LFEKVKIDFDNTQRQIDNNIRIQIEKELENVGYKFDKKMENAKGLELSNLEKAKTKELNELNKKLDTYRQHESSEKRHFIEDDTYYESVSKKVRTEDELVSFNHMTHMSSMSIFIIENRVSPELKKMITILQLCSNDQDIPIFLNAHSVIIDNYVKQVEAQKNGTVSFGEIQIITLAYLFIYMNQLNVKILF
jgi:Skp family chaperone for outer membrane proteins